MDSRFFTSVGVLTVLIAVASLTLASGAAQTPKTTAKKGPAAKAWIMPRTSDGQPDLQGVWDFRTITPLERPAVLGDKQVLTDEEAADLLQQTLDEEAEADKKLTELAESSINASADQTSHHERASHRGSRTRSNVPLPARST